MKKTCIYIGRKLVIFLLSIFLLSLITFYIARLAPGDPLVSYYGDRVEKMSPEERDQAEEKLGLKEPISAFPGNIRRTFSKSSRAAWEIRCFLAASVLY